MSALFLQTIVAVIKICDLARGVCRNGPATTTQTSDPFPDLSLCPAVWIHVDLGLEFLPLFLPFLMLDGLMRYPFTDRTRQNRRQHKPNLFREGKKGRENRHEL